jgi:hypothetical protein
MTLTNSQALTVLRDTARSAAEREAAARHLKYNASLSEAGDYVRALADVEFGVRWNAADALVSLGPKALVPLLTALSTTKLGDNLDALSAIQRVLRLMDGVPHSISGPLLSAISRSERLSDIQKAARTALDQAHKLD